METTAMETESAEPVVGVTTAAAPGSRTTIAPEASTEERADLHPETSTHVVICEVVIEGAAPLR
jgi:hypothetical protein